MRSWHSRVVGAVVIGLLLSGLPAFSVSALAPATSSFQRTWERTDLNPAVRPYRTWIWGPGGFSALMWEPYEEAPDGLRLVQYFDKSRMEDNSYRAPDAPWDVSNGLLVKELISGEMQIGDASFSAREPANVNVAGDADDANGPTYSTFTDMLNLPPREPGATIIQRLSRDGAISDDPSLAQYGATATELVDVPGIRHRVASPFWTFMTSSGQIYENGTYVNAPLFQNPYYATGLPITEAYWANVKVGNVQRDVLMQCFERRCLTYAPTNPVEWQVEMGNVGLHYYMWRHGASIPAEPPAIDLAVYNALPPAPLSDWPFPMQGETLVRLQNDAPYPMQVTFDGPVSHTMTIPTNPDGIVYPSPQAYPGCDPDGPFNDAFLPPGNYRIKLDFIGGTVDPGRGHWTLIPDAGYFGCYYVVEQDSLDVTESTTGSIDITYIEYDSVVPDETSGEYVDLTNIDDHPIQMAGWQIVDIQGNGYTFPEFVLQPGASVSVHNCTGQSDAGNLYSGACEATWNNGGDTATLINSTGEVVDTYAY